ncbi:fanconi-associated nuclease 1-like isoform X4 [Halictus rubicundus]|uniref:fanconi-associated nuclease 1-like isoform X4 n=1 Tax=Halictus rubicundus TaxID=77578 RepID=UPI0040353F09
MLTQKRIDEFFKSTSSRHALNNTKNNFDIGVTSCSENGKKRKKLKLPKDTTKHFKSNKSFSGDVKDVKKEFQRTNTSNYDEAQRDTKEHIEQNISLSQTSTFSISSSGSEECTILYDSFSGLSQQDHNDARLLFEDNDIVNESINLTVTEDDIDMLSVNKPREDMSNNETHLRSPEKEMKNNNEFLEKTPIKKKATFNESTSPKADTSSSSPRFKKSKYSPKMSSGKSSKKQVTEKLFDQFVNIDIAKTVIEHMNLAKQGAIPLNNFNLEEIYSMDTFDYSYGQINPETSVNYQLDNVTLPRDLDAKILIGSIFTVLSKPFNCGYFEEKDLDFLYSILTLPEKCQMLLARMIKRKRGWHRKRAINYPNISTDLRDVFKILESQFICTSDIKDESFPVILDLLQTEELRPLCQNMKINYKGTKDIIVAKLIELSKKRSLFPGMRSPSSALYDCILNMLDYCVRITDKTWDIIDAIMTLLSPNEDPQSNMSDIFLKLRNIYIGNIEFPIIRGNQFPIFSSKSQLITYVYVKSLLSKTLKLIGKKNWEKTRIYGKLAMDTLPNLLETEILRLKNSKLPFHVRKFMPGYVWLKILSKSIDAFKRNKDIIEAEEILNFLIEQNCHMHTYKGKWYCDLAIIKMHHQKDIDSGALVIIKALNCEHLSQVDKIDLLQRAKKILNKKTFMNSETKMHISKVLNDYCPQIPKFDKKIVIYSSVMPTLRGSGKSSWLIENSDEGAGYGSVEMVALYHYVKEQNFSNGLHCEGNLPILLFATLFWEELFEKQIPGAFAAPYETAPADLFTKHFYEHRKKDIDIKLQIIDSFNADPASFSTWMEARFGTYRQYMSLMPTNLLKHNIYMKEIVYCLGVPGVTGICKRLLENFKLWSAGFPDLIVWNYDTRQHKIVEVKGPKDVLSTKQQLWLKYLNELGLNAEVCLIQGRKMTCVDYRFKAPKLLSL